MSADIAARGLAALGAKLGQRFELVSKTADYFGIQSGNTDNASGFADMVAFCLDLAPDRRADIILPAGDIRASKIDFRKGAQRYRNGFRLRGAGRYSTRIIPVAGTGEPVFMSIEANFAEVSLEDFFLCGSPLFGAPINPGQYPLAVFPAWDAIRGSAGISFGRWSIKTDGWDRPVVMKGSSLTGGAGTGFGGNMQPNQFIDLEQCEFNSRTANAARPTFVSMGQFGQIEMRNTQFHKKDGNESGPSAYIGIDHRLHSLTITAEDLSANTFSATNPLLCPEGTPVRVIGSNFPTSSPQLSSGTTYFLYHAGITATAGVSLFNGTGFRLATSPANAIAGTWIDLTGAGTPANYRFVQVWATAMAGDEFTTEEPHFYMTTDEIQLVGSNLPTGLTVGTPYFVIRTGHRTFRLASSASNASAGTALSLTGGTLSDFGFVTYSDVYGSFLAMGRPYTVKMRNVTSELSATGIHLCGGHDIDIEYHSEQQKVGLIFGPGTSAALHSSSWTGSGAKNGAGTGLAIGAYGQGCRIRVDGKQSFDTGGLELFARSAHSAQVDTREATISASAVADTTVRTYGVTRQIAAAATIDIGESREIVLTPGATQIANFNSLHLPGSIVAGRVLTGAPEYIEFVSSGNLRLGNVSVLRLFRGAGFAFELQDIGGAAAWSLLSYTPLGAFPYQSRAFSTTQTVDTLLGNPIFGLMTSNCSVQPPSTTPPMGHRTTMIFQQDSTGGRNLTFDSGAYAISGAPGSGTANQKLRISFEHDGTKYVQIGSTGWYT